MCIRVASSVFPPRRITLKVSVFSKMHWRAESCMEHKTWYIEKVHSVSLYMEWMGISTINVLYMHYRFVLLTPHLPTHHSIWKLYQIVNYTTCAKHLSLLILYASFCLFQRLFPRGDQNCTVPSAWLHHILKLEWMCFVGKH